MATTGGDAGAGSGGTGGGGAGGGGGGGGTTAHLDMTVVSTDMAWGDLAGSGVVSTVEVTPATWTVAVGATQTFTAVAKDAQGMPVAGATIAWASTNTSVASIDAATGIATGNSVGTTMITATSGSISSTAATLMAATTVRKLTLTAATGAAGTGTITSAPAGVNCPASACTMQYADGTQVTLTAAPDTGSTFMGWGGACAGTAACTVTLTADTAVTYNFYAPPNGGY